MRHFKIKIVLDFDDEERNVVKSLDDEGELTVEDFHGDIAKILNIVRGSYNGCDEETKEGNLIHSFICLSE